MSMEIKLRSSDRVMERNHAAWQKLREKHANRNHFGLPFLVSLKRIHEKNILCELVILIFISVGNDIEELLYSHYEMTENFLSQLFL